MAGTNLELLLEATLTAEEKALHDLDTELYPIIEQAADNKARRNRLISKISDYIDKNSSILMTNIVGLKLYFNAEMDNVLFTSLNIDKVVVENAIHHNTVFNAIKEDLKRIDHFIVAIPFLLLIKYLLLHGEEKEALFMYGFLFFKPYSSSINHTFKYLNTDQMSYTVENMNNRFKLKTLGTVQACIEDTAEISFNNYKRTILDATDKGLYDVFVSGIQTRIVGFISKIFGEYLNNAGKYKPYETENRAGDGDENGTYYVVSNVTLEIDNLVNKITNKIVGQSSDKEILSKIDKYKGNPKFGIPGISINKLESIIRGIIEKEYGKIPVLLSAMISAFVVDSSYKLDDIKTPVFLKFALDNVYSVNNVKKTNVAKAKSVLREIIESVSAYFIGLGKTQQAYIQKAVYLYFTFTIMNN